MSKNILDTKCKSCGKVFRLNPKCTNVKCTNPCKQTIVFMDGAFNDSYAEMVWGKKGRERLLNK